MRRLKGILVFSVFLSVLFYCLGAEAAYYPRELALSKDGVNMLAPGARLTIKPGETLLLDVYARDISGDGQVTYKDDYASFTPGAKGYTVAINDNLVDQNGVHLYYNVANPKLATDKLGTIVITENKVVDTIVSIQIIYTDNATATNRYPTGVTTIHLKTGPSPEPGLTYLFVPKSISLTDTDGQKIDNLRITAGGTKTLYAVADDYNGNRVLDEGDYTIFAANAPSISPTVEVEDSDIANGTSTIPSLLGKTPTMSIYPYRIATVTVKALNEGGKPDSDYPIRYTEIFYQIGFNGSTGAGVDIKDILPNNGEIKTPQLSVAVIPRDDGGTGGNDSGGSCDALGIGMLLLAVPALGLFGRRRF